MKILFAAILFGLISCAHGQGYPGGNDSLPVGVEPAPNEAPIWLSTPNPQFQNSVTSAYEVGLDFVDPEGDPVTLTLSGCTFPSGVALDDPNNQIDHTAPTTAGTTTGCILSADDGTNSPVASGTFPVPISDVSALCWADQGNGSYLEYPADRNGSICAPVSEAIGPAQIWGGYDSWPGTNPTILHVTNRNDSGPGSLREHLQNTSGCREIVFDVGGVWALLSKINVNDGCVHVNAHATGASTGVWLRLPNSLGIPGTINVKDDGVILEGFVIENTGVDCGQARNAVNIAKDIGNVQLLNMALLGGTDQNLSTSRGDNIQLVDTLIANTNGVTTCNHNMNAIYQGPAPGTNHLLLGTAFINSKGRNPRSNVEQTTIANTYTYNARNNTIDITVDIDETSPPTFVWNIIDTYYDAGPNVSVPQAMRIGRGSGSFDMANASEIYIKNTRQDSGICADEWDSSCLRLQTNSEANLRHDLTDNFFTGFVSTDISGLSAADNTTLQLQNNGPRPNSRSAGLEGIYDGAISGTLRHTDTYTYTRPANSSGTYNVIANPHADTSPANGYPDLLDQFQTDREGFYAN